MGGRDFSRIDAYLRFSVDQQEDPKPFLCAVESIARDVEVVSLGNSLEIVKQVGSPANLERNFSISGCDLTASHTSGWSTESASI